MNVSNFSVLPSPANQCVAKSKINDDQIDINPGSSQSPVPDALYEGTCQTVTDYSIITKVECASPENFHVKNENSNDIRSTDWVDDANNSGKSVESVKKTHETHSNEASLANHSGVFWHTKSVANASTMTDWDTPENLSKTDIKDDGVLTSFDDNIRRQILYHEDLSNCTTIHLQRQENAMAKYLSRLQPMSLPLGIQQFLDQHNVKPLKIDFKRKENDFKPRTKDIKSSTNLDGSTVYYCPECFIETADRDHLETHLAAHKSERRFVCNVCGACLKRKEHLDQHKRRHSEERPFVCNVCCKGFKRNEHLRRHYVIHSGNKMYTCPECGKAFSRKDHLNKHSQTHNLLKTNNT